MILQATFLEWLFLLCELLHLPFGKKSINQSLNKVFIFSVHEFYLSELLK